jgi:hypothetical protein
MSYFRTSVFGCAGNTGAGGIGKLVTKLGGRIVAAAVLSAAVMSGCGDKPSNPANPDNGGAGNRQTRQTADTNLRRGIRHDQSRKRHRLHPLHDNRHHPANTRRDESTHNNFGG